MDLLWKADYISDRLTKIESEESARIDFASNTTAFTGKRISNVFFLTNRVGQMLFGDFFPLKTPHSSFCKTAFSLLKSRLAIGSLVCLFFGFCHHAIYQLQKTPWKPSLKPLLSFVETIGRRFSFLFATHLLLEHLSAQLDTAATAHSALRHNVRVLQAYLVKKTFLKCSVI